MGRQKGQVLTQKFRSFRSIFIGNFNGNSVYSRYIENYQSKFHVHPATDEMIVVQTGTLYLDLEYRTLRLAAGNSYVVPAGVRHRMRADELSRVLVICRGLAN